MKNKEPKLLAISFLFLTLLNCQPVAAGWGQRKVYKISDITQQDADKLCRKRYGRYTSAKIIRDRDVVQCGTRQANNEFEFSKDPQLKNKGVSFNYQEHHLSEVCEVKHPGYGTWVGDGGYSCYDSYREF